MEQSHNAWHPAFVEVIQVELEDYKDSLEFISEYQLTTEPLKIDCVVIKKKKDVVIKKNIAAIFREVNLLEYKSPEFPAEPKGRGSPPDDYVSVEDFYKVYAYGCLYIYHKKVPVTSLTLTFIESHYPRELLAHLSDVRGFKVEESAPGIYNVMGDILPIQVIDSRKLPIDENLWLKGLDNRLKPLEAFKIMKEVDRQDKVDQLRAYLNVVAQSNYNAIEEAIKMNSEAKSLEDVLERTGVVARWEAKWEAKNEIKYEEKAEEKAEKKAEERVLTVAKNLFNLGLSFEAVVSATMLDPEKVKAIFPDKKGL